MPVRQAEGYSLTYLSTSVTSVYPSNTSTREQLDVRINRISQKSPSVEYQTYHCGVLTWIYENHEISHDLSTALKSMANIVNVNTLSCASEEVMQ